MAPSENFLMMSQAIIYMLTSAKEHFPWIASQAVLIQNMKIKE
jgi:hypothetical protein